MNDTKNDIYNIFANEHNDDIKKFNAAYINYVSQCVVKAGSTNDCNIAFNKLKAAADTYNGGIALVRDSNLANFASTASPDDKYNKIITKYDDLDKKRSELDDKLKELYDIPGSKSLDYKYNYDSTIYSGILVTIIASGIIYYTFTKL